MKKYKILKVIVIIFTIIMLVIVGMKMPNETWNEYWEWISDRIIRGS